MKRACDIFHIMQTEKNMPAHTPPADALDLASRLRAAVDMPRSSPLSRGMAVHALTNDGYLIEGMGCPGGCVAGAGTNIPVPKAQKKVQEFVKASSKQLPPKELGEIELK